MTTSWYTSVWPSLCAIVIVPAARTGRLAVQEAAPTATISAQTKTPTLAIKSFIFQDSPERPGLTAGDRRAAGGAGPSGFFHAPPIRWAGGRVAVRGEVAVSGGN